MGCHHRTALTDSVAAAAAVAVAVAAVVVGLDYAVALVRAG